MGATDVEDIYELSPLQRGMLLHSTYDGASDMYLSQQTYTVEGPLDIDVLVEAWSAVVTNHPALRVSFHSAELAKPLQVVHRTVDLPVHTHDWRGVTREEQQALLERLYTDDRRAGMDLTAAPLQRLHIAHLAEDHWCLVWTYHHLLLDGWSVAVFMNDLLTHYHRIAAGGPAPAPAPPFRSYIGWLQRQDVSSTKQFWTGLLDGVGAGRGLPLRPVDPRASTGAVDRRKVMMPDPLVAALRAASARHRVTVATMVQAGWAITLHRIVGHPDVTFGCASSGRPPDLPQSARIVGVFANTLPVRVSVPHRGDVGDWVRGLQHTYAQMRRYEFTPLADIKKWAGASGQNLFQTLLSLENYPADIDTGALAGGVRITPAGLYDKVNFPIALSAVPELGSLDLAVHEERFPPGFVDVVLAHLHTTYSALTTHEDLAEVLADVPPLDVPVPEPPAVSLPAAASADAGSDALVAVVLEAYREVLELEDVDPTASFFELGGDSFDAVRAISRIPGASVGLLAVNPSALELAAALAAGDGDDEEPAPSEEVPLEPVPRDGPLVATFQQEAAWFMNQLNPRSTVLHIPFALRLRGRLDREAMGRAIHALVVRHEALRTRFVPVDGIPLQVVDAPPDTTPLEVLDLTEDEVRPWAGEFCIRPFDLARGPVVRAAMARISTDEHVLVLVLHHIVGDGWSVGVLGDELSRLYKAEASGTASDLVPLRVQPADYAVWQRRWLDDAELERQLGYWRSTLEGLATVDFPADRPRPEQPTGAGTSIGRRLPDDVAAATHAFARSRRVSLLAVFQAALLSVLHRYTGQTDLPVGSMFSGRTRPDIEPLVGYFGNVVVLRADAAGNPTFAELVRRCHQAILGATTQQDAPFRLVVESLRPERVTGRNPLFQIGLTLLPSGIGGELDLGGVVGDVVGVPERYSLYDISVDVADDGKGHLDLAVEYSTELFDADRMGRFMEHLAVALRSGLDDPDTTLDALEVLSPEERHQLRHAAGLPAAPLHELVATAAARTPTAAAVVDRDGTPWPYAALDIEANQLAHVLRDRGVQPGDRVGICLRPGASALASHLAVWRAGGVVVAMSPTRWARDLAGLPESVRPVLVLTTADHEDILGSLPVVDAERVDLYGFSVAPPDGGAGPGDLAVMTPVGPDDPSFVAFTHSTLAEQVSVLPEVFPLRPGDRVLRLGDDGAASDLFWPLVAGATVVAAAARDRRDADAVSQLVEQRGVTVLQCGPALLDALVAPGTFRRPGPLRRVCVSGGRLPDDAAARLRRRWPEVELLTVWSCPSTGIVTSGRNEPDERTTSLGRPLSNRTVHLLDPLLRPVPVGMTGRLHVGGSGLPTAVVDGACATSTTVVADPFAPTPGARMLVTDTEARWRSDGLLEHVGRSPHPEGRDRETAGGAPADRPPEPPRTGTERWVVVTVQRVLEVPEVRLGDHFFDLGGSSLDATRMVAAARSELGVDLDVRDVLGHPGVRDLAGAIDARAPLTVRCRRRWWRRGRDRMAPPRGLDLSAGGPPHA